jgi:hypothetical protein
MSKKKDTLLSAAEVATIWNERAREMGYKTNYTRFSVFGRRTRGKKDFQPDMETPIGKFYLESRARSIKLYPKTSQRVSE